MKIMIRAALALGVFHVRSDRKNDCSGRETIRSAAPESEETIKYGMPTYVLAGNLVYFAGYKKHVGVYPVPAGDEAFQEELAPYRAEKSTVRFPHIRPVPLNLVEKLVRFRIKEQAGE